MPIDEYRLPIFPGETAICIFGAMKMPSHDIAAVKIYLAPLQGFTDFVYRRCFEEIFQGVDKYFIPYITVRNDAVAKKFEREILPQNNPGTKSIPQVLVNSAGEMQFLTQRLTEMGYTEINLNLGCPYPMVTNRGMGAGLLPHPEKLEPVLKNFFNYGEPELSVKMRAGLNNADEIEKIIPVLNSFPIKEVILHPRIATQLYKGEIHSEAFFYALNNLRHPLVYNGDIFSVSDFEKRKADFPSIARWMLGRGILKDPFLPAQIKGFHLSASERKTMLNEFHTQVFEEYTKTLDNEGNVLNKMHQFWSYFCHNFENPGKCFRRIKKTRKTESFKSEAASILDSY